MGAQQTVNQNIESVRAKAVDLTLEVRKLLKILKLLKSHYLLDSKIKRSLLFGS